MSNLTKLFNYEGNNVTFKNDEGIVYVNATQMAKPFAKKPSAYLRLPATALLLDALIKKSGVRKSHIELGDLVHAQKGGLDQGTWLHEDVAIDFAQWLSIDFRLWCNDRIKELLTEGSVSLQPKSEDALILDAMNLLIGKVAQKEEELKQAKETILIQAPKVQYVNEVLASESCHTTTTIAKEIGVTGPTLNKMLHTAKIQYKQDGHWVLYAPYQAKGFAKTRTHNYYDSEGKPQTNVATVWTEKGREFIHQVVKGNYSSQLRIN